MTYIATFFSHFGAVRYQRLCRAEGIDARTGPVPRDLSSSCGTCVRYLAEEPNLCAMDEDVEGVYEKIGKEEYTLLMNAE